MEHYKISKLIANSIAPKSVRKKWIEVNNYQVVNIVLTKKSVLKLQF